MAASLRSAAPAKRLLISAALPPAICLPSRLVDLGASSLCLLFSCRQACIMDHAPHTPVPTMTTTIPTIVAPPQAELDHGLIEAASSGNFDALAILLTQGANPNADSCQALFKSSQKGHVECVRLLISASDLAQNSSERPLLWAANNGHAECVKLLIPAMLRALPHERLFSHSLLVASQNGHAECARLLIPVSYPQHQNSRALREAAANGHVECVKLLLSVSAPQNSLLDKQRLLSGVLARGHARVAAAMLAYDPNIFDGVGILEEMAIARSRGHEELADLFLSIIERQALSAVGDNITEDAPRPASRL